jgi:hypothetical protein
MSTKKITALTELSTTPATGDLFPVVDVSDTTDASSGTTKSIKPATVFKAAGIGAGNTTAEPVKIDTSNGRLGIGLASPSNPLHVSYDNSDEYDASAYTQAGFQIENTNTSATLPHALIHFRLDKNGGDAYVGMLAGAGTNEQSLVFGEQSGEWMRLDKDGNVLIGGTATPTSSVGNMCLFNGTAPAASVANGIVLYAQDATGSSELKVRDEAGNIATLSPHNFDLLGGRSEDMAWSYSCKNAFVGKEIAVDMTKVIRALEKLTGESYIKIRDIADSEKLDWDTEELRKEAEQKTKVAVFKARKAESDAYPTSSSTKAEIKTFLGDEGISYEDAPKAELFKKVQEFIKSEPTVYVKKSKPSWIK